MSGSITMAQFHEVDWRVMAYSAGTHFRTGSLAEGVALAATIDGLAAASTQDPDIDLRSNGVTVRLRVNDAFELTEADVALAGEISAAAGELGLAVDLAGLQTYQITIDALEIPSVMPFWAAVLGYERFEDVLVDPHSEGPTVWFQQMDAPRPQRNRIHIDLYLPEDRARARIDAALAVGGRIVYEGHAPKWWTLADPEGNEVDVAAWPDLDEAGEG
jgi:4a-hydroxytetrahydrobiopterin dehydratase